MRRAPKWATSIARIAVDAKLLKMTFSSKAAGDESAGGVPSGYVEDAFKTRTPLEVIFSSFLPRSHASACAVQLRLMAGKNLIECRAIFGHAFFFGRRDGNFPVVLHGFQEIQYG